MHGSRTAGLAGSGRRIAEIGPNCRHLECPWGSATLPLEASNFLNLMISSICRTFNLPLRVQRFLVSRNPLRNRTLTGFHWSFAREALPNYFQRWFAIPKQMFLGTIHTCVAWQLPPQPTPPHPSDRHRCELCQRQGSRTDNSIGIRSTLCPSRSQLLLHFSSTYASDLA